MASINRDLRLDFFRGLALWFIFVDHVPSSVIGDLTLRNFGFSDATEIFVFISGYTAAIVYGKSRDLHGTGFMTLQVLKRCWQLYAAHILVFVFFVAQVAWVANRLSNASILEDLNVSEFLENPSQSLVQALVLRYRPVNLDVLPLYMMLLLGLPPLLMMERISRSRGIAGLDRPVVAGADLQSGRFRSTMTVRSGISTRWDGNCCLSSACSVRSAETTTRRGFDGGPGSGSAAALWIVFSLLVCVAWKYPVLNDLIEPWVENWLYPIDKNNLGEARVLHFLAIAYLAAHYLPAQSALLRWRVLDPVIRAGQHSLYVFCVGILLSLVAHIILVEFGRGIAMQLLVVAGGLILMSALAYLLHWYRAKSENRVVRAPGPTVLSVALLGLAVLLAGAAGPAQAQSIAPVAALERSQRCSVPEELTPLDDALPGLTKALRERTLAPTLVVLTPQSGLGRLGGGGFNGLPAAAGNRSGGCADSRIGAAPAKN